jgi:hypothetical protein
VTALVFRAGSDVVVEFRLDGYESLDIPATWLSAFRREGQKETESYRVLPGEIKMLTEIIRKAGA